FLAESKTDVGVVTALALHLVAVFVVALMCHGELARSRPAPERLTEFYLYISLGGVLGGAFNALVAPVVFSSVVEHEIALVGACLLLPPLTREARSLYIERWFGWQPSRVRGWCVDAFVAGLVGVIVLDLLIWYSSNVTD